MEQFNNPPTHPISPEKAPEKSFESERYLRAALSILIGYIRTNSLDQLLAIFANGSTKFIKPTGDLGDSISYAIRPKLTPNQEIARNLSLKNFLTAELSEISKDYAIELLDRLLGRLLESASVSIPLAFEDMAMQVESNIFERYVSRYNIHSTIAALGWDLKGIKDFLKIGVADYFTEQNIILKNTSPEIEEDLFRLDETSKNFALTTENKPAAKVNIAEQTEQIVQDILDMLILKSIDRYLFKLDQALKLDWLFQIIRTLRL
jgi:hypothetical protein